jgi:hypothetical protein
VSATAIDQLDLGVGGAYAQAGAAQARSGRQIFQEIDQLVTMKHLLNG